MVLGESVSKTSGGKQGLRGKPVRGRFVPELETLEERVVLSSAPVAGTDVYGVFQGHVLTLRADQGALSNDTDLDGDALTITAVNGSSEDVGNEVFLPSGATVTV